MSGNGLGFVFDEQEIRSEWSDPILNRLEAKMDRIIELLEKPKRANGEKKEEYPPEFRVIWAIYPLRAGSNPKRKAYHALQARLKAGVPFIVIQDGVQRYLAYCTATAIVNTGYVMQAARFFGPDREWENRWEVPAATPQTDEEWYALARKKNVATRPGESWASFKARIQAA